MFSVKKEYYGLLMKGMVRKLYRFAQATSIEYQASAHLPYFYI